MIDAAGSLAASALGTAATGAGGGASAGAGATDGVDLIAAGLRTAAGFAADGLANPTTVVGFATGGATGRGTEAAATALLGAGAAGSDRIGGEAPVAIKALGKVSAGSAGFADA